jgi:hypothetical protein
MKKKLAGECSALFQSLPNRLRELADNAGDPAEVKRVLHTIEEITRHGEEGIQGLVKFSQKNVFARAFDIALEWRLGAMLSSSKTQTISVAGGNTMGLVNTIEEGLGAVSAGWFGKLTKAESQIMRQQAKIQAQQMFSEQMKVTEWIKAYRGKNGDHIWSTANKIEPQMAESAAGKQVLLNLNDPNSKDGLLNKSLKVLGGVSQFSGNLLNRGDTRTKLIVGRAKHISEMYGHFVRKGMDEDSALRAATEQADRMLETRADLRQQLETAVALQKSGDDVPEEMAKLLDDLNVKDVKDIEATLDAIDSGRKAGQSATYTGDIRRDPLDDAADYEVKPNLIDRAGRHLQGFTSQVALARMIAPFVKTPTNIASETWERTMGMTLGSVEATYRHFRGKSGPLSDATFNFARRLEHPDAAVRAKAAGELTLAVPVATGVIFLANTSDPETGLPRITGTGPKEHRTRKMWEQSGWQPRSIMVGGKYISYDRLDPITGALFGFAADVSNAINFSSEDDIATRAEDFGMGMVAAIASNITSKTWMSGVRQMVDIAFGDSDYKVANAITSALGSFVPSAGRDVAQMYDREIKDIDGWGDAVLAKVPYFSQKVDVRRNFLGEEVSYTDSPGGKIWNTLMPFNVSQVRDSALAAEFKNLEQGISMPSTKMGGVDLKKDAYDVDDQSAYDRMLEISSTTKMGGRTMRQALRHLIGTESYQRLDSESIDGESNPRTDAIKKVVERYRKKARTQLLKERPELRADVQNHKEQRLKRRQGLNFNFYQQ